METNLVSIQSQGLDFFDFETAAIAIERYLEGCRRRWARLDSLHADRARLKARLARDRYAAGKLDDARLKRAFNEIDAELASYDDRPTTLYRQEMMSQLREMTKRFRQAARADRERRKAGLYAA